MWAIFDIISKMSKKSTEFEGRILNVDVEVVRSKIIQAGGEKLKELDFKRYVFDVIPKKYNTWVRLRSDGETTTLTVKEIRNDDVDGTDEWEITVPDVDTTLKILEKIGLKSKGYQENRRELYDLDGAELAIDFWPKLNPYLEIEAESKEKVLEIAQKLGFEKSQVTGDGNAKIYASVGIDIDKVKEIKF
jgi:adenylate cyclase class 2